MNALSSMTEDESNELNLKREKSAHIVKAARSATLANILAPLLCIPMYQDEVQMSHLVLWLVYMFMAIGVRSWIVYSQAHEPSAIQDPERDLQRMTFAVGIVGFGWGLGWPLMAPELSMVNRMIYVYMTTAAMISSMFAYSVNRQTFYAFTLPIMIPAISTLLWPTNIFPWPFSVGMTALYLVVLSIAKNFCHVFETSIRLRFRNESLYQELASERDQSVAANVAKSKFIAAASHDLRQPLHAVNINLELFNAKELTPKQNQLLHRIKSSINALNTMFDGLLNMSKLDAYVTKEEQQEFLLTDLAESVREIVQSKADSRRLEFSIEAPPLVVLGDKLLLQQILLNLALNALQYTEHGRVAIEFSAESDKLSFRVVDSGVGISQADQLHIFNEFFRADRTRSVHEGLGLGLTIVKRLCHLIGAEVEVKSNPGEGSVFTVTTMCPTSSDLHEATWADTQRATDPDDLNVLQGKCIAIYEDDEAIVEAYRQTLAARGARTVVLSEHAQTLEKQLESINHIDCILSDFRLKLTTGDKMIEKLRENYNHEIPAVIVTGDTSPDQIHIFSALNVKVLHKPVTFQKIVHTIEEMIAD
jgi:signal transduction histidine kinase